MIRDCLIVGIRDTALSERLQLNSELMLEKATKAIQRKEAVHKQQSVLNHGPTPSPVDAVKTGSNPHIKQSSLTIRGMVSNSRAENIAQDAEKAHTVEINAPHKNQFVTDAIIKDTIAPNVSHKLFPHFQ